MEKYISQYNGSLLIIGGGQLFNDYSLKNRNKNIHFLGHKTNVENYFLISDYYISLSLSEGLPNSVLESLSFCKPAILSSIESHREIKSDFSKMVTVTKNKNTDKIIKEIVRATKKKYPKKLDKKYLERLSSYRMSSNTKNYILYLRVEKNNFKMILRIPLLLIIALFSIFFGIFFESTIINEYLRNSIFYSYTIKLLFLSIFPLLILILKEQTKFNFNHYDHSLIIIFLSFLLPYLLLILLI